MITVLDEIPKALSVAGQLPLDGKIYFPTLTQLLDLGEADNNAYKYYKWMKVLCAEDGKYYIWTEVASDNTDGILPSNFQYPANVVSNGVDYSNQYYNFLAEAPITSELIARPYTIFKFPGKTGIPANTQSFLEVNDVVMGYFTGDIFWLARYKTAGAVNDINNWAQIRVWNPLQFQ